MKKIIRILFFITLLVIFSNCNNNIETSEIDMKEKVRQHLEDGIYLLKEMAVSEQELSVNSESERIISTNELFERNRLDSIKYYLVETGSFVPLVIASKPKISANPNPKIVGDTIRLSQLHIILSPEYSQILTDFTTKNINKKIVIVIGGKAITKHKIREAITGGKLQISRCTDRACEILLTELENNVE